MTKVGLPGAAEGWQEQDITIAGVMKSLGYSTGQFGKNHFGDRDEQPAVRRSVVILGGGPVRIGQGIEFDACCVEAVAGVVMVDEEVEAKEVEASPNPRVKRLRTGLNLTMWTTRSGIRLVSVTPLLPDLA